MQSEADEVADLKRMFKGGLPRRPAWDNTPLRKEMSEISRISKDNLEIYQNS